MSIARSIVAIALLLPASPAALAQLPVAPPPHPTLIHVAKEYERFKLPLPKPGWKLVRTRTQPLAFFNPNDPTAPLLAGTAGSNIDGMEERDPKVLADGLRDGSVWFRMRPGELTCIAVQCRALGEPELAKQLYAMAVGLHRDSRRTAGFMDGRPAVVIVDQPVEEELRSVASEYWRQRIMADGTDQRVVLEMLLLLDPDYAGTKELALTLAPRRNRPGTAESLIDELVECDVDWDVERLHPAMQKLVSLGFDAVPALIEHCRDTRFTRSKRTTYSSLMYGLTIRREIVRVGHLCTRILHGLLGDTLSINDPGDETIDPGVALKVFGRAQLVGEERWLLDIVLPTMRYPQFEGDGGESVGFGGLNEFAARILAARHPQRLAPIWQTILYKRRDLESDSLAGLIASCGLERDEKRKLLLEGVALPNHRVAALRAMKPVDDRTFRTHLLAALKSLGSGKDVTHPALSSPEVRLAELTVLTDDPECWEALFDATRRAVPQLRIAYLTMFWQSRSDEPRYQKLRYLYRFLADDSRGDRTGNQPAGYAAAQQIAFVLDLPDVKLPPKPSRLFTLLYRARAGLAAERELERLRKR